MNSRSSEVVILLMLMLVTSCGPAPAQPVVVSPSNTLTPLSMDAPPTPPVVTATQRPTSTATTQPTVTPTVTPQTTPTPTMLPEASRRAIFERVWHVVNNNYYDPDFRGVNWDAMYNEYEPRILAARTQQEFYAPIKEMIAQLNDDHSVYLTPQEARAVATGFVGYDDTGFFAVPMTDSLVITDVFPNSPAAEVGLRPRDRITAIDGRSIPELLPLDAAGEAPGPQGDITEFTIRSLDQLTRTVRLEPRPLGGQIVPVSRRVESDPTIGYLRIPKVSVSMGNQVARELETLLQGQPLRGLIIDLRANGGGDQNALRSILGQFVVGTVGQIAGRRGSSDWTVTASKLYESLSAVPVVVLVDQHTNSAAEVMAAVLQDQERAHVVGVPTPGNVETVAPHESADGSVLWLAQQVFNLPNDATLAEHGVIPDVQVDLDWTASPEHNDPYIREAVQVLTGGSPRS